MAFQDLPIRRKVTAVIMLTTVTALLVAATALMVYDLVTARKEMVRSLSITSSIIASNCTAALIYQYQPDAQEILNSALADEHIKAAAIYDLANNIFVWYPSTNTASDFPQVPGPYGPHWEHRFLTFTQPAQKEGFVGTVYLKSDLSGLDERLRLYVLVALLVLGGSASLALVLSGRLQRRISSPILALADTAKVISAQRDYSVRAPKTSSDELGLLTDAFNHMLTRIQEQTVALRESEERLRLALEASRTATWHWDIPGNKMTWDRTWEEKNQGLFGIETAMSGGTYEHFIQLIHPQDRAALDAAIKKALAEKTAFQGEFRVIWPDNSVHYLAARGKGFYNEAAQPLRMTGVMVDISERKQAEEALREQAQMLDLANVMARDLHDRIILWNTGMEKIYGWSKDEALGKVSHELLRTEFPQTQEAIRAELFERGHWEGELIHFRKDGVRLAVASQWVVHNDANGRPAAILEINNDITERKRAEHQILQLNAELEQRVQNRTAELIAANKELEAFTYSVAHDLRAPLRHIDAFSRILFEDFGTTLSPEARRYLDNIQNGSRKMSRLVDDLLNLAHVGRQELLRQPISLSHLVGEVLIDLKRETDGRAIEWRIQALPIIQCDAGLMKQVFANLLSNAVKYTRTRDLAVVEIGSLEQNGNTAVFVRDNGVGFSMKYADKLFGVFQRLHRAEEFEGTGVGLATVERIVRRHGGSVWAEADVGKGATFYFSFPKEHQK